MKNYTVYLSYTTTVEADDEVDALDQALQEMSYVSEGDGCHTLGVVTELPPDQELFDINERDAE